ncbi:MAG: hypothetical protein EA384_16280 [Spirochaetaceae bacterium]|nr:MAG: hypothetical protein EA384_16280 [Spirochaetaceae bacterium]
MCESEPYVSGTLETRNVAETTQAIDLLVREKELLTLCCDQIIRNKAIGIYDGAYRCVELATGTAFSRRCAEDA